MTEDERPGPAIPEERAAARLRWFLVGCIGASLVLMALMFVDAARWGSQAFIPLAAAFAALLAGMVVVLVRTAPQAEEAPARQ